MCALYDYGFIVGLVFFMHIECQSLTRHLIALVWYHHPGSLWPMKASGCSFSAALCPLISHPLWAATVLGLICAATAVSGTNAIIFRCLDPSFFQRLPLASCFFLSFFFIAVSLLPPGCPLCPCSLASS